MTEISSSLKIPIDIQKNDWSTSSKIKPLGSLKPYSLTSRLRFKGCRRITRPIWNYTSLGRLSLCYVLSFDSKKQVTSVCNVHLNDRLRIIVVEFGRNFKINFGSIRIIWTSRTICWPFCIICKCTGRNDCFLILPLKPLSWSTLDRPTGIATAWHGGTRQQGSRNRHLVTLQGWKGCCSKTTRSAGTVQASRWQNSISSDNTYCRPPITLNTTPICCSLGAKCWESCKTHKQQGRARPS